ncbi:hypothetical protein EDC01DRAFT_731763 [Geopyxis carbonaria]|nr:hypothetical protein EDC01DRAFT_731763 [Geopyxis carbonaria]
MPMQSRRWMFSFLLSFILVVCWAAASVNASGAGEEETNGENAVTYPLGGTVDGSDTITIKWTPTTKGTISIHLLKGPQKNLVDLGPIVTGKENTGDFVWKVPDELEGAATMPKDDVYGLKVVDDLTGKFEYSPPFEISITDSKFVADSSVNLLSPPTSEPSTGGSTTNEEKPSSSPENIITSQPADSTPESQPPTPIATTFATKTTQESVSTTEAQTPTSTATSTTTGTASKPDEDPGTKMETIFMASGAGVGGLALLIVGIAVWARIKSDKKKMAMMPPKSFRDRRSIDSASPIRDRGDSGFREVLGGLGGHRRFQSSSSFGDNGRPSEVFDRQNVIAPKTLSVIQGSPPPTPFSAPPLDFPPTTRKVEETKPYAFAVSPHFRPPDWKPPVSAPAPPPPAAMAPAAMAPAAMAPAIIAPVVAAATQFKAFQPSQPAAIKAYQPPQSAAIKAYQPPQSTIKAYRPPGPALNIPSLPSQPPQDITPYQAFAAPLNSTNTSSLPTHPPKKTSASKAYQAYSGTKSAKGDNNGYLKQGSWDSQEPLSPPPPAYSVVEQLKARELGVNRYSSMSTGSSDYGDIDHEGHRDRMSIMSIISYYEYYRPRLGLKY